MKVNPVRIFGLILLAILMNACSQPGAAQVAATSTATLPVELTEISPQPAAAQVAATSTATLPVEPTEISPQPTVTPTPGLGCFSDSPATFTDYATWTKVNETPIRGHELWVNVYVNDLAKDTYLSASGNTFPVCATIVKTHLDGAESTAVTAITVMVKMPPGYDPDHNDWWWGMYDKNGKTAAMSGKVQVCIACHQPAAEMDYVFSQAVLAEAQK